MLLDQSKYYKRFFPEILRNITLHLKKMQYKQPATFLGAFKALDCQEFSTKKNCGFPLELKQFDESTC